VAVCSLAGMLQASLPHLSLRARIVMDASLLSGGSIGTAQSVARHLGLSDRFALARLLKQQGLPPLHSLASWASVLTWVAHAERTGCSLCELAFRARKDPAFCYRTVKRVTGHRWKETRLRGLDWVLKLFVAHCS